MKSTVNSTGSHAERTILEMARQLAEGNLAFPIQETPQEEPWSKLAPLLHQALERWLRERDEAHQKNVVGLAEYKALSEAEAGLSSIVRFFPDSIIRFSLEGMIHAWNLGAQKMYGYLPEEINGKSVSILVPSDRKHEIPWILEKIRRGENIEAFETVRLHKDGTPVHVWATISPIYDSTGQVFAFLSISRNISNHVETLERLKQSNEDLKHTQRAALNMMEDLQHEIGERRRIEAVLAHHARELARSNADLEQFSYAASHDLREPLRMIASFLELLQDSCKEKLDAEAQSYLAFAVDGAVRMQAMITDLLEYSRFGIGERMVELLDSRQFVNEALANLAVPINETAAHIDVAELPKVHGVRAELVRVFQNLLSNALKFRGDKPPHIDVSARRKGDIWEFAVRDNGIGIDPVLFDRIFKIFQRLHERGRYPGTGLGLAMVKKIIERHGGEVRVESEPGKGSTFFFTLPHINS